MLRLRQAIKVIRREASLRVPLLPGDISWNEIDSEKFLYWKLPEKHALLIKSTWII